MNLKQAERKSSVGRLPSRATATSRLLRAGSPSRPRTSLQLAGGNPSGDLPENVADFVTAHGRKSPPRTWSWALEAVGRVAGEESELAELWDDADKPEWRESLEDLSERLRTALR